MLTTRKLTLTLLAAAFALSTRAAGGAEEAPVSPLVQEGAFNQHAEDIGKMINLTLRETAITLDRQSTESEADANKPPQQPQPQPRPAGALVRPGIMVIGPNTGPGMANSPIEKAFIQLMQSLNANMSGSSAWGTTRSITFQSQSISGRLESDRNSAVSIRLNEEADPRRTIEVTDDNAGGFRLIVSHPEGDIILINQSAKGAVTLSAFLHGKPITAVAPSYAALYKNNRELLDKQVLPVLRKLGIKTAITGDDPRTRGAAMAALVPLDDAQTKRVQAMIKDLNDPSFEVRDKATKELDANFDRYRTLIEQAATDNADNLEVSDRLKKIIEKHPLDAQLSKTVTALGILDDPGYLVSLMYGASDSDRTVIAGRLQKLTGQNLGSDPAAWKKYLESQPAKP